MRFHGRYYQIDGFKLNVLPVQKPLPRYWFSVVKEESFVALGRAAQPIITLPHLCADSLQTLTRLVQVYRQGYFTAGGDDSQNASQFEIPLIFYTCVAPTRIEAQQQGRKAILQYLAHQHHGADVSQTQHKVRQLVERNQLWFALPPTSSSGLSNTRRPWITDISCSGWILRECRPPLCTARCIC